MGLSLSYTIFRRAQKSIEAGLIAQYNPKIKIGLDTAAFNSQPFFIVHVDRLVLHADIY